LWPLTGGHLIVFVAAAAVAGFCWWRGRRAWATLAAVIAAWGLAGSVVMHRAVLINAPLAPIPDAFLPSRTGRVLDLGAGSGRGTVGVLLARPKATVTAVDLYRGYYGIDDNTPDRLYANATRAGVADRVQVRVADMRELPFAAGDFEAAISVAAIDHLRWTSIEQALRETARVLTPGGQLLIVSLNADAMT
jgi:ubiquinone/menaquinone biosynthesis C-methylase UbiE